VRHSWYRIAATMNDIRSPTNRAAAISGMGDLHHDGKGKKNDDRQDGHSVGGDITFVSGWGRAGSG